MHFSAEVSETFRHWWRSVQWTLRHQCKKFETLRHQTHGAEVSWVRSVLGPKCPYTGHKNHTRYIYCRGYSQASVTITVIYFDWCSIPHSNLQACVQSLWWYGSATYYTSNMATVTVVHWRTSCSPSSCYSCQCGFHIGADEYFDTVSTHYELLLAFFLSWLVSPKNQGAYSVNSVFRIWHS